MSSTDTASANSLITATSQIVSAYLSTKPTQPVDVVALTADVYSALAGLAQGAPPKAAQPGKSAAKATRPAVSIGDSVQRDYLVCLEDGKKVKMLKRYLRTNFQLTPEQYRTRWNLPKDYPMVAPSYAKTRSQIAKKIGLGSKGGRRKRAKKAA